MILTFFSRLLKKSAVLRTLVVLLVFIVATSLVSGIILLTHRKPVLEHISPTIGEPGEILVIQGKNFGNSQGDNWIQIAGSRISGTACIKWTNTTIMILIPPAVEDGLLQVVNRNGKSNPLIFANKNNIPIAAQIHTELGIPEITALDTVNVETGKLLVISGRNFGITRTQSQVLFSWQMDSTLPLTPVSPTNQSSIACSEHDFDYEIWSDQELRVRIPDGATSGNVYVQTERGLSNPMAIQLINQCGTKKYTDRHTYVLSLQVDISGVSASGSNMLFLSVPIPVITAMQRSVEVTASSPKPYMENYKGTILHQIENLRSGRNEKIAHSFLLTNYGISTVINPALVKPYSDTKSPLYVLYTATDPIIPSDNQDIILKASAITGAEKNPYLKAKLIYSWLTANIQLAPVQNPNRPSIEALSSKTGDAYDMAILFCALTRASGIPSVPVAGVLVNAAQNTNRHWWCEFYLEGFGWVPADPGLGVSAPLSAGETASRDWYFGNLDSYHIAFSRGWNEQKPMNQKSRIVYKPRSFAFQPIWEESAGNIKSYTSFWGDPKVTGVY